LKNIASSICHVANRVVITELIMEKFLKKLLVLVAVLVIATLSALSVSNNYSIPQPQQLGLDKGKNWVGAYLSGQHAIRKNDYTKASKFFSESINIKAINPELNSQVLELLIASGHYEQALELAKKINASKISDETASAGLLLYADKIKDNDYSGAIQILSGLPDDAKKTIIHKILLAWAELGSKNSEKALEIMSSLDKKDYFQTLIVFNYALIAEIAGDSTQAAKEYKTLMAKSKKVPTKIAENAYRFFTNIGDTVSAKNILESNSKLAKFKNQDKPPEISQAAADALNEVATMLLTERNFSKATVFFRIGLLMSPKSQEALMLLATILSHEKDYKAANEIFKEIEGGSEFYHEAQMGLAHNYIELKNEIAAKNILENLTKVKRAKIEAFMALGDLSRQHEDFTTANKFYTSAIEAVESKGSQSAFWPLYFARGVTFERLKRWNEAEEDFKKALALEPNQPDVLNYFAYSLLDMNKESRYDEAKEMLLRALKQSPNDPHIIDSIGWVYFKIGDYEKAVEHLEKAAAEMPYDPTINDHLGDVYWKLGRENEAEFAWERALENKPENRFIEALKNKLANGLDKPTNNVMNEEITVTPRVELEVQDSQF